MKIEKNLRWLEDHVKDFDRIAQAYHRRKVAEIHPEMRERMKKFNKNLSFPPYSPPSRETLEDFACKIIKNNPFLIKL